MKHVTSFTKAIFITSLLAILPVTAFSQEAVIEEIIVTAQKREQSLQDVPLSVTAISGERLASLQRNEIADLAKLMPGVTFKGGATDNGRSLQIRGIGTTSFSRAVEQSVGMMIDGVVTTSLATMFLDMNDVQRIEVLRGPQGMLFGKNASAGIINIITNDPTEEFEWGFTAGYAEENEQKYSAYFSGPISEQLLARLAVSSSTRDPYIKNTNPNGNDYNDRDEQAVNLKILYRPNENLDVQFGYKLLKRGNLNGGAIVAESHVPPLGPILPGIAAAQGGYMPVGKENDKIFAVNDSEAETDQDLFSLEIDYALGDHTIASITSLTKTDILGNARGFSIPLNLLPNNRSFGQRDQVTQEIRLHSPLDGDFSYVAGFYYYKNELDRNFDRVINFAALGQPFVTSLQVPHNEVENESYAVFGQVTWSLREDFRLSLGGRYTSEDISAEQIVTYSNPDQIFGIFAVPEATPGEVNESHQENNFSWRVIAEYDLMGDAMLFGSVARGYKGPGVNTLSSAPVAPTVIVKPEIPTNFEVGIKSEWLDGRLQVNATAFFSSFDDFQASLYVLEGELPAFYLDNAGELQTQGLELELTALPADNLLVSFSLAAVDATFEEFKGAQCYGGQTEAQGCIAVAGVNQQDLSGKDLPYSPDLSYNLFARYDIELASMPFDAYVHAMYYWQDDAIYNTNNDPATLVDGYGLLDLGFGIESDDGRYDVQFWVKNATDEFHISDFMAPSPIFGLGPAYNLQYTYTRRMGITLSVDM